MHLQHWRLRSDPFRPPRDASGQFFAGQEEALARLLFLVEQRRRCGLLTGADGVGKSWLLTRLKHELRHTNLTWVAVDAAGLAPLDVLEACLAAGGLVSPPNASNHARWQQLADLCHGWGAIGVAVVWRLDHLDHAAENLAPTVLRLMRLCEQTGVRATFVLSASSRAGELWSRALAEFLDLWVDLPVWTPADCTEYLRQALQAAGAETPIFSPAALQAIVTAAGAQPGRAARLCELCLLAGAADEAWVIDDGLVASVSREFCGPADSALVLDVPATAGALSA